MAGVNTYDSAETSGKGTVVREPGDPLLLQIRSDRRLGHEWDDWDGAPLPDGGVFGQPPATFFRVAAASGLGAALLATLVIWLVAPRMQGLSPALPGHLVALVWSLAGLWLGWLAMVGVVFRTGRNWLPPVLAEQGLLPWAMPKIAAIGSALGLSRDHLGNSMLRVFNRLASARSRAGFAPGDLLILLPRCLGKEAMRAGIEISSRYGVPLFVASRGLYARQMIASRRPRAVVAVACERDLVSGVHDVAGKLPVLGTTLALADGPCRNTAFTASELEGQVRRLLGLLPPEGDQPAAQALQ